MPPIPDGLGIERDPSGKGLVASWWSVPIARVDSAPDDPDGRGLVVTATTAPSAFTSEGIGTLNGWLAVASQDDLLAALGEPTTQQAWEAATAGGHTGTCWCGQTIVEVEGRWWHREALGHAARPA